MRERRLTGADGRSRVLAIAPVALVAGWAAMWGLDSAWNPLAFVALWTGAALAMWGLGRDGYPGATGHGRLALLPLPLWSWFGLFNTRVGGCDFGLLLEVATGE